MTKRFQLLLGLLVFVLGTTCSVFGNISVTIHLEKPIVMVKEKGPVGVWNYEVKGAEEAYRKGVLFVRQENGTYFVEVHLDNGVLNGQDVQVQGDTLKFIVNLDGVERVYVVLDTKDDIIFGEASSSQESFIVKGTRRLPPQ